MVVGSTVLGIFIHAHSEREYVKSIASRLSADGFNVRTSPTVRVAGTTLRPDLVVKDKERSVVIEVKHKVVSTRDVLQTKQYANYSGSDMAVLVGPEATEDSQTLAKQLGVEVLMGTPQEVAGRIRHVIRPGR